MATINIHGGKAKKHEGDDYENVVSITITDGDTVVLNEEEATKIVKAMVKMLQEFEKMENEDEASSE